MLGRREFQDHHSRGVRRRLPDSDFTSKLLLDGLPAGQDIFYRVRFDDISESGIAGETQVGHFRTAPT